MKLTLDAAQRLGDSFGFQWGLVYQAGQAHGIDQTILDDACAALTKVKDAFDASVGGNVTPNAGGQRK